MLPFGMCLGCFLPLLARPRAGGLPGWVYRNVA